MLGLIYTALVIAVAGICANAKLAANLTGIDFPVKKMKIMCRASCKVPYQAEMSMHIYNVYANLNQNMSSKELFESICPIMYKQQKCMSNCQKAFNYADTTEPIDMGAPNKHAAVLRKICTSLTEKLSTLDTLTECSSKIYPLIVKPEENAKCRKMCCSDPNAEAPL